MDITENELGPCESSELGVEQPRRHICARLHTDKKPSSHLSHVTLLQAVCALWGCMQLGAANLKH
jgi:hypothetical protein